MQDTSILAWERWSSPRQPQLYELETNHGVHVPGDSIDDWPSILESKVWPARW
jgi:hypothetical protein